MSLARRAFLRTSGAALLTLAAPKLVLAAESAAPKLRRLKLHNIHTGEKLAADYCVAGRYEPQALAAINKILRDFRTGEVHDIDPRLLDLLTDLNANMESDAAFEVISGYRSPATNGMLHNRSNGVASKSLHMQGLAMDVRLPGKKLADLHNCALKMAKGGVGYYPTSNFVHVDVGRVRRWSGA
jgi:uncharacterized protein YcbK (DUF882 family)